MTALLEEAPFGGDEAEDDGAAAVGQGGGDVYLGARCADAADVAQRIRETIWLTYRCGFAEMAPYGYTDDGGWGCMLRSAQMLMANGLLRHLGAGGDSRRRVLRWFADAAGPEAVYSIHNMVRCGLRYDMLPGEWYGPGIAAHVLRDLCECHAEELDGPALTLVIASPERPLSVDGILEAMAGGGPRADTA